MLIDKQPHHNLKTGGVCFFIYYSVRERMHKTSKPMVICSGNFEEQIQVRTWARSSFEVSVLNSRFKYSFPSNNPNPFPHEKAVYAFLINFYQLSAAFA